MREHGYRRPDSVGTTPVIEVVFHAVETHLAIEIMRGVERVADHHELAVGFTEARGGAWIERVLRRRPTGLIAVYSDPEPTQQSRLAASGIPLVVLDPTGEPLHATPSVGATNWSGGVAATRHLLELGHRRIGIIGGPRSMLCAQARLDGFRAAMARAGAPVDPKLVRVGRFTFQDGVRHGRSLLRAPDPPTAVFAADDLARPGHPEESARQDRGWLSQRTGALGRRPCVTGPGVPTMERQVPVKVGGRTVYLDLFHRRPQPTSNWTARSGTTVSRSASETCDGSRRRTQAKRSADMASCSRSHTVSAPRLPF